MIALLRGKIFGKNKDSVIVETSGGIGYEVRLTASSLSRYLIGQDILLHTYFKVTDSSHDLYGFEDTSEKDFFELLMTVSGVGPKSAMNILSLGNMNEIQSAIARGDVKYLTGVQGMGKKTAERLVVELKSKITNIGERENVPHHADNLSDVIDGLMALGYSREEAKHMIEKIDVAGKTPEQILKLALKK
jgi:Holliday junction DNA helicase RuvA